MHLLGYVYIMLYIYTYTNHYHNINAFFSFKTGKSSLFDLMLNNSSCCFYTQIIPHWNKFTTDPPLFFSMTSSMFDSMVFQMFQLGTYSRVPSFSAVVFCFFQVIKLSQQMEMAKFKSFWKESETAEARQWWDSEILDELNSGSLFHLVSKWSSMLICFFNLKAWLFTNDY